MVGWVGGWWGGGWGVGDGWVGGGGGGAWWTPLAHGLLRDGNQLCAVNHMDLAGIVVTCMRRHNNEPS